MSSGASDVSHRHSRIVLAWTLGLYGLPLIGDWIASGRRGPFAYAAADSFYYLTVARNVAEHGRVSFDQQHWTNGFHPLWQYLLALVAVAQDLVGLGATALLRSANVLSIALVALAIYFLGRALTEAEGHLPPTFLVMPVGVFSILLLPVWLGASPAGIRASADAEGWRPLLGTLWLQTNAMETPLVLALYGWMVFLVVRHAGSWTTRTGVFLGVAGLGIALARLDHAIFPLVILLALIGATGQGRGRRRALCLSLSILVLGLAVYVIHNRVFFGTWLPVSGSEKSTFPHVDWGNWRALGAFMTGNSELKETSRVFGLFVPMIGCLANLVVVAIRPSLRRRAFACERREDCLLFVTVTGSIGTVLLAAYNAQYVPLMQQGTWYFPISMILMSLIFIHEPGVLWPRSVGTTRSLIVGGAVWSLVALTLFLFLHRDPEYHREMAHFHHEVAPKISALYEGGPVPGIASDEDGVVAFSTGLPVMNMRRLALDAEAASTRSPGELLDLAYDRGYTRYSMGPQYLGTEHMAGTPDQVAAMGARRLNERLRPAHRYRATVEFRDPTILILKLSREGEAPTAP